ANASNAELGMVIAVARTRACNDERRRNALHVQAPQTTSDSHRFASRHRNREHGMPAPLAAYGTAGTLGLGFYGNLPVSLLVGQSFQRQGVDRLALQFLVQGVAPPNAFDELVPAGKLRGRSEERRVGKEWSGGR